MNATGSTRIERGTLRMRRFTLIATLVGLVIGIGGCGGGGGSYGGPLVVSSSSPNTPRSPPPVAIDPKDRGTVVVTVTDALGAPVAEAHVEINTSEGNIPFGITDANGIVTLTDVAFGPINAEARKGDEYVQFSWGYSDFVTLAKGGHLDIPITIRPAAEPAIGVDATSVGSDGIAIDGRSLEFTLNLIYVQGNREIDNIAGGQASITIDTCRPDTGNDGFSYTADCVSGPIGSDAPYDVDHAGEPLTLSTVPRGSRVPFSAALLLDQSRNIVVNDPWDVRQFALKYFLVRKPANDRIVLAGFASDDGASGELSLLPQKPATIFPVENPQFTSSSNALFPTIDSLALLEGGASPLYASIDSLLDFTAANAPAGDRRAVVVLTDGLDDTCGSPTQCRNAQHAVIEKSRNTGVRIVTLGLLTTSAVNDHRPLSVLAGATGGASLWVDPSQLGIVFGELSAVLDGSAPIYSARFRIQSSTDGAFQSGRTVLGTLHWEECPFFCSYMQIPFAVQIP